MWNVKDRTKLRSDLLLVDSTELGQYCLEDVDADDGWRQASV